MGTKIPTIDASSFSQVGYLTLVDDDSELRDIAGRKCSELVAHVVVYEQVVDCADGCPGLGGFSDNDVDPLLLQWHKLHAGNVESLSLMADSNISHPV